MSKKKIIVRVEYVFSGTLEIEANSKDDAIDIANNGFGMVCGLISSNDTRVIDWNFPTHPESLVEAAWEKK